MLGQILENRFYGFILCVGFAVMVAGAAELVDQTIQLVRWAF